MSTMNPEASQTRLVDLDGNGVVLADLWRERPVVLVFLRHFG